MFQRTHNHKRRTTWRAAALAGVLVAALAATGCSQKQETVCKGQPEHLVLVPSTSKTDYDVSVALTPEVSEEVVRRAATSCGRVTVGIQDGRPAANLVLRSTVLKPEEGDEEAYNAGTVRDDLVDEGNEFAEANLIEPLAETKPTGGSPFFSALAKIGEELEAHDWSQGTIVLVGDGLVVEQSPGGGPKIRFGVEPIPPEALDAFVPFLESLKGSCVILVGAGATSKLPQQQIRASQQLMGETLEKAGVGFVASRSPELPPGC